MEVAGKLSKLSSGSLLLPLLFILSGCLVVFFQILANLVIFGLYMVEVSLPGIEVMLVLPAIVSSVAANTHTVMTRGCLTIFAQSWPALRRTAFVSV